MSYSIVKGDLEPDMPLVVYEDDNPADLSLFDYVEPIQLRWQAPDGTVTVSDLVIEDASVGSLVKEWDEGDTDLVGVYRGQILITDSMGRPTTFPSDGLFIIWNVYRQLED